MRTASENTTTVAAMLPAFFFLSLYSLWYAWTIRDLNVLSTVCMTYRVRGPSYYSVYTLSERILKHFGFEALNKKIGML